MKFAQKLRELRQDRGLSEARLAELSGMSFGAVHNYGLGNRQPTFSAVVRIARALGVTCDAFSACEDITGESPPPPTEPKPRGRPRKADSPAAEEPAPAKKGRRKRGEG